MAVSTIEQLGQINEEFALGVKRLEIQARDAVDEAWHRLAGRSSLTRMPRVLDELATTAKALVGTYGDRALRVARQYTEEAFDMEGEPEATQLAAPVEEALAAIEEGKRHLLALIQIRSRRMRASGMGAEQIAAVMQADFRQGGRTFSIFRGEIKTAVAGAIQGLAQAQARSVFAPAGEGGDNGRAA